MDLEQQQQQQQQLEQQQQQQLEQQQQQQQELEQLKQLLPYIKPLFAPFYAQYLIFERPTLTPDQSTIVDAMFVATSLMPELPLYDEIFQRWAKLMITSILTNDLSGLPKVHEMVMQGTMYNLPGLCIKFWEQFFAENATPDYAAHLRTIPLLMIQMRDKQVAELQNEQDIASLRPFTKYQLMHSGATAATYNPDNPSAFQEHLRDDTGLTEDDRRQIRTDLESIKKEVNPNGYSDKEVSNMRQFMHGIEVKRYKIVAIPNGIRMVTLNSYVAIDKTIRIDAHLYPAINVMRDGIVSCARHIAQLKGVDIDARNKLFHSYFQAILAYFTYTPYADQYADATHEFQANPKYGRLKNVFAPFMSILGIEDTPRSCVVNLTEYGVVQEKIQSRTQQLNFSLLADLFGEKFDNYECSLLKKMKDNFRDGLNTLITHFQSFPEYQKTLNAQIPAASSAAGPAAGPASPAAGPASPAAGSAAGLQPSPVSPQGYQIQSPQGYPIQSPQGSGQGSPGSAPGSQPDTSHLVQQQQHAPPETPRPGYQSFGQFAPQSPSPSPHLGPQSFGAQAGYQPPSSFGAGQFGQPHPSSFGAGQFGQPQSSFGAGQFGQPHQSSFGAQSGYPQPGYPQHGYPQPGYPQHGYPPQYPPHHTPSSFGAQPGYPQSGQSFEQVYMDAGSKKTRTKRSAHKRSAHKHKRSVHKHKRSSRKHK